MTAITKDSVSLNPNEWTLINDGSCTLQVLSGEIAVAFGETQPDTSKTARAYGHFLKEWESMTNNYGGKCWGRSCYSMGLSLVGVTSFE